MHKLLIRSVLAIPAALLLCAALGCAAAQLAAIAIGNVNPPPAPPPPVPSLASISPNAALEGGPSFTLTALGANFESDSYVEWNSEPLATTYVSSIELEAQVPMTDLVGPDTAEVSVATPAPGTEMSSAIVFTIQPTPPIASGGVTLLTVDTRANDMVWDPISQQVYLSVASSNGANGNTITELNPLNGQLGISQDAESEPDMLALASDGSCLYAGIDGTGSVQRFTLPNLGTDIDISLGSDPTLGKPYYAMDLQTAPGSAHTIAVVRGILNDSPLEEGGVVVYDDAAPRPSSVPGFGYTDVRTGPCLALVPVISALAKGFAICDHWFSSVPGPTIPNRMFAHAATSLGSVSQDPLLTGLKTIFEVMHNDGAGHDYCIYQYGSQSILVSVDYLSDVQDTAFRDFSYFEDDCKNNDIPSYTFIEPCYSDVIITPSIRQIVNIPTMTWRRGSVFCCQSTMPFVLRKRSGKVHFY